MANSCSIVELRQSTLHAGRRDETIALFEEHFIEGQEACGIRVVGQFRCAGDPDRFVWMRAFPDLDARLLALEEFYCGPVWREQRIAAGGAVASSDVLLLRPAGPGLHLDGLERAPRGAARSGPDRPGMVVAVIDPLAEGRVCDYERLFEETAAPLLGAAGASLLGCFTTEPGPGRSARMPPCSEHLFVWLASFADPASYTAHRVALRRDPIWTGQVAPALRACLAGRERVLELLPTGRSLLRHRRATRSGIAVEAATSGSCAIG
jgi:hypothetical protein